MRDNRVRFEVPQLSEVYESFYDDADNITRIDKTVGAGSPVTIESFTSDLDGNLLTRTDPATSVVTTYRWDDFNRLEAISTTDNSKKQTNTFGVSGFRRKTKDKNNVETTEYAAGLATAVSKATGGDTITYLMGGGGIMGFERESDGATFWFITDSLSTVRDVVSAAGSVVASYEFSEYGQRIASSESGVSSQKTWVGGQSVQDEVADTGLFMMGHRFYDPSGPGGGTGRFLNRDPIGFAGGMNLFAYASGSPVSKVDAEGLVPAPVDIRPVDMNVEVWVQHAGGGVDVAATMTAKGYFRMPSSETMQGQLVLTVMGLNKLPRYNNLNYSIIVEDTLTRKIMLNREKEWGLSPNKEAKLGECDLSQKMHRERGYPSQHGGWGLDAGTSSGPQLLKMQIPAAIIHGPLKITIRLESNPFNDPAAGRSKGYPSTRQAIQKKITFTIST